MITDLLRRLILGTREKFTFKAYKEGMINVNNMGNEIVIYIHIPFCKSLCPYCPYNKIVYKAKKAGAYKDAVLKELKLFKNKRQDIQISSIYFGGGTPTLLIDEIVEIVDYIRENYSIIGDDIGIEIHPQEVSRELLIKLKKLGVNMISLGVQTFREDILEFLGRGYGVREIEEALSLIKDYDFKCVDIDIMTNLPGQTMGDIKNDLKKVYSYDIDQLSIYPLILFPMMKMDKIIRAKNLSRFNEFQERKILSLIDEISQDFAYERSSIWTYSKDRQNRYTSVTRESFIGFGAGASSHFGNYFYLNTFDVDSYIETLNEDKWPINIINLMTEKEKMIFWIFWRFYDGVIDENRFRFLFQKEMCQEFRVLFLLLKALGLAKKDNESYILTRRGRWAYHFVEKQYSIHYLNNLWQKSMEEAWIEEIKI